MSGLQGAPPSLLAFSSLRIRPRRTRPRLFFALAWRSKILDDFRIIFILAEQGCIAVSKGMPPCYRDTGSKGGWFDVVLHYAGEPVGLCALLSVGGEDVVPGLVVRRFGLPGEEFRNQIVVEWDEFL